VALFYQAGEALPERVLTFALQLNGLYQDRFSSHGGSFLLEGRGVLLIEDLPLHDRWMGIDLD
jgi:hypothetical protein